MNAEYIGTMHIQSRSILTIAALAFSVSIGVRNEVNADELKEAKVTQVIQDVRVLPSNASSRPAAVNEDVRQGTAVQTGAQSRSELTFKDKTITRLGEKSTFSVATLNRLFPVPIVNDYGSNVPILIGFGALALVLVALTRGRLGYQRYREEVPDPATAPI